MAKSSTKGKQPVRARSDSLSSNASSPGSSSSSSSSSGSSASSDDEDVDPDLAVQKEKVTAARQATKTKYEAPRGMVAVTGLEGKSSVDWEEVNRNHELELWAIRIPPGVKAKHLDGLTINLASGGLGQALGGFTAKKSEYSLYPAALLKTGLHEEDEKPDEPRGGDEMTSLVALLPRKSSGDKLEQAPRAITRHLIATRTLPSSVLSHLPSSTSSLIGSSPSPVPGAVLSAKELLLPSDNATVQAKRPVRPQPFGLMKHRHVVAGMGTAGGMGKFENIPPVVTVEEMDVDVPKSSPEKKRRKKEEDEAETPRKKKKVKKEKD